MAQKLGLSANQTLDLSCSKNLKVTTRLVGLFCLLIVLLLAIGGLSVIRAVALEPTRRVSSKAWATCAARSRPSVDLRLKFGLANETLDGATVTPLLNVVQRVVVEVVDSASDVLQLDAQQLRPAPDFNRAVPDTHITGIATVMQGEVQRMLVLADTEQLMSSAETGLVQGTAPVH